MVKSKTSIDKKLKKKTNSELVKTLIKGKKNNGWLEIVDILSRPRRKRIEINLSKINHESKEGEKIVIPGKILSQGEIDKKINVIAFNFSKKAKEKLLNSGCKVSTIFDEIKLNPSAKGLKVLK